MPEAGQKNVLENFGDKISDEIGKEAHDEFQPGAECRKILETLNYVANTERTADMGRSG